MSNLPPIQAIKTPEMLMASINQIKNRQSEKETKRAAIYIRVSRVLGDGTELSPEVQERECRKYALEHNINVVAVLVDLNETGKNSKRRGFRKLLKMVHADDIDCVIVQYIDRQFRNGASMIELYRLLEKNDVEFISITEQIDTRTYGGTMMLYIMALNAELPVRMASDRCRQTAKLRREKGLANGGYRLGYCDGLCSMCTDPNGKDYCPLYGKADRPESLRGTIPVPHPIEQHAVRLIAHSYHNHMSYKEISILLNTHTFELPDGSKVKFRTKGVKHSHLPGEFTADAVRDIVGSPFYVGYVAHYPSAPLNMQDDIEHPERIKNTVHFRRTPIELHNGQHQPLYEVEIWEENQKIRVSKNKTPVSSSNNARIFPLSTISYCYECYQRNEETYWQSLSQLKRKRLLRGQVEAAFYVETHL